MKRILTHTAILLLIVFLLPVCSAEARRYDFKVLLEGKYERIYVDNTYIYVSQLSENNKHISSKFTKDLQPVLQEAPAQEEITLINEGKLWGGANRAGELVIPIEYTAISAFSGGYATAVKQDQTYVILDTSGNEVLSIDPKYKYVSSIKNGVFFVSETTKLYTPFRSYYEIASFAERDFPDYDELKTKIRQTVESLPKVHVMDMHGNLVTENLEPDYKVNRVSGSTHNNIYYGWVIDWYSYSFTDTGIAFVKRDGKYGIIDSSGNVIYDFILDSWKTYENDPWNKGYVAAKAAETTIIFDPYGIPCAPLVYSYSLASRIYDPETETAIYLNSDGETVCRCDNRSNSWYDGKGSPLSLNHLYDSNISSTTELDQLLLKTIDGKPVDVNLYNFGVWFDNTISLVAINEIPEPQAADGGHYICMMLDNPLINVDGNVSTIV